ncbi:unnamed protein product, partial [Iphiclides podalirius]
MPRVSFFARSGPRGFSRRNWPSAYFGRGAPSRAGACPPMARFAFGIRGRRVDCASGVHLFSSTLPLLRYRELC